MNRSVFNPALDDNATSMAKFIDGIAVAASSGNLDHLVVYGYASPEGLFLNNYRLSVQRCNTIAEYISARAGVPMDNIRTSPGGVAWEGLRALVKDDVNTPARDAVLRVLDEYIPDACTDQAVSDQCRMSLIAIDNGLTYKWMLENLFPKLRFAVALYTYGSQDDTIVRAVREDIGNEPELIFAENIAVSAPLSIEYVNPADSEPAYRFAVKNNLLYDAALLPNVELEWLVNDNWSVALEGDLAWWGKYSRLKSYRLAVISPEVKRWIKPRAPWHGFYVGAFAGAGLYDFQNGGNGYRGEGGMAGLSFGYMWPVGRHLSLEAAIGAGYLYSRYKEYWSFEGHHLYLRTKSLNYVGPLKVKFSIVWRFFERNKSPKINLPL